MTDLQRRIDETKRMAFLQRVCDVTRDDPQALLASGQLGQEMGLPYEQTLEIVRELHQRGWLHQLPDLAPPRGPMIHLTASGIGAAARRAA